MFSLLIPIAALTQKVLGTFCGINSHLLLFISLLLLLNFIRMAPLIFTVLYSLIKDAIFVTLFFLIMNHITQIYNQLETLNRSLITYQRIRMLLPAENLSDTESRQRNLMNDGELLSRLRQVRRNISR
ncbi:C3 [Chickpea chlorosis virus-B]|uniref:C3 n=1 Tax=Chickpea chlorosis virus-B TaxID=887826 RepID=E5DE90_9GEMI|nr:C3 [Chickpea chlorosis virus-B]